MIDRVSGIRSIARTSAQLLAGNAVSMFARAAYILLVARALAPSSYGILNYAQSWYLSLVAFTFLGQDIVLGREIGRSRNEAPRILGATFIIRQAAIILTAGILAVLAFLIEQDTIVRTTMLILLVALIARSLWTWCASVFTAFEEARYYFRFELVGRAVEIAAVASLIASSNASVITIAAAHSLSWTLQAAVALIALLKRHRLVIPASASVVFKLLKEGVPGAITGSAIMWLFQLPVILFRSVSGEGDALGQLVLGMQLFSYCYVVPACINSAALPVLSRSAARHDGKDRSLAIGALVATLPTAGIVAIVLAFLAPLVVLLFGSEYAPSAQFFAHAAWMVIPLGVAALLHQIFLAGPAKNAVGVIAPLTAVAVQLVSFSPAVSRFGYDGIVGSFVLAISAWLGCTIYALISEGFFSGKRRVERELSNVVTPFLLEE